MIIKELRLCNFLVFPGEQVLPLPTQKESNLVVVLAPNNTGKTNIIRALKFLFYGHLPDCTEVTAYRLIHDGARALTKVGSAAQAWVEVTFELEDEELTLRRSIKAIRRSKDQWIPPEILFGRIEHNPRPRYVLDSESFYQTKLQTMVPERLFDAFYFKGEPLDGKLLGGVGAIRESLASFLHEDRWSEIEGAAERIRQQYTNELKRLNETNQEYTTLLNNEELFRTALLKEQTTLEQKKKQLEEVTSKFNDITVQLQELGSASEGEKWVNQLRDLRAKQDDARRAAERSNSEIMRLVGASKGIPFLLSAIPAAKQILSQLQEDNILPADVSERFVDRVLAGKRCVCGHEHTEATRSSWLKYKDKTLSLDLNRGLSDLLNALQENSSNSYTQFSVNLAAKLQTALDTRAKSLREAQQYAAGIQDLENKLRNSPVEAIRDLTQQLRSLASQRERINGEVAQLQSSIDFTQKNLRNLKEKLEKARPTGAAATKEKQIQQFRMRAEKLRLLVQESREVLNRSFHELLQRSVSEYYDRSAYDGSKARINRSTLLPVIETNGQVHGNLGGGQSQLLALAYIVSLSRLRKSLHSQMQKLGVGFGRLDDQSFFLDSPFNHVTEHYAHAIARFLEGNARQVVLLLARHQWNLVRSILEPANPRFLTFKYHTLGDKIDGLREKDPKLEDFAYQVNGSKLELIAEIKGTAASPYTTITPIN